MTTPGVRPPIATWPLGLVLAGVAVALVLHTTADPDLWGHLAMGRLTVQHGLPHVDPYSYTAGATPVVDHEWLSDVVGFAWFHAAGPLGLVVLRLLLLAALLAIVAGEVRRAGGNAVATGAVMALVVLGGFPWLITVRPQLYTFLFFAAFVAAIARADAGDVRALLWVPLLTAAWVNLHGGVVAGLVVLGTWGVLRSLQYGLRARGVRLPPLLARGTPERRVAVAVAAVLVLVVPAALASPYGIGLWRFFGETLSVRRVDIAEWQHVSPGNVGDLLGLGVLAVVAFWIATGGRRRDPVHLLLMGMLAAGALESRRHLVLAVIGSAILGAPFAAAACARRTPGEGSGRMAPVVRVLVAAVVVALLGVGVRRAGCIVVEPETVPRAAVEYLRAAGATGKLAVAFDWGEYVIWHLAPRVRVSIDGRRETVYPPAVLEESAAFAYGLPAWRAGLDRDAVDLALVSPRFAVYRRLTDAVDWRLAFADTTSGLFVRRGSAADTVLAATSPPVAPHGDGLTCLGRDG